MNLGNINARIAPKTVNSPRSSDYSKSSMYNIDRPSFASWMDDPLFERGVMITNDNDNKHANYNMDIDIVTGSVQVYRTP